MRDVTTKQFWVGTKTHLENISTKQFWQITIGFFVLSMLPTILAGERKNLTGVSVWDEASWFTVLYAISKAGTAICFLKMLKLPLFDTLVILSLALFMRSVGGSFQMTMIGSLMAYRAINTAILKQI